MVQSTIRRPGSGFRSRPASWAPPGEWRLYRAWGDLPRESGIWRRFVAWLLGGWQQLLYIGITSRTAVARWAEHCGEKSWAPDIAVWERDPKVWGTLADVRVAERAAIIGERPVHNVEHNGNNPGAVRIRRRLPQHVVRSRLRFAFLAAVWLALFSGLWLAAADVWHGWDGPRNAAVGASLLATVVIFRRRLFASKRRRRRR